MSPAAIDWRRSALVLIAPDAVARHLALSALRKVADAGFRPVAYRLLQAGPEELDAMHRAHVGLGWTSYRYRLIDQLFALGPSLAVVMEDAAGRGDPHERLRRRKGHSDPARAEPGTIRQELGSINGILSLLHVSDDAESSALECAALYGGVAPVAADPCAEDVWAVAALLAAGPREERGFDEVVRWVRSRVVAAAWDDLAPEGRALAAAMAAAPAAIARPGAGAALAAHLRGGVRHPLAPVLAAEHTPPHPGLDLATVAALLAAHGIHMDRWASLVLATSARFAPRRAAAARQPWA